MKLSLRWKSACAAVATLTMFNIPLLAQQAQAAPPPLCVQWGWIKCDPLYPDRFSEEWGACFEYWSEIACPWSDGVAVAKPAPATLKTEDGHTLARQ